MDLAATNARLSEAGVLVLPCDHPEGANKFAEAQESLELSDATCKGILMTSLGNDTKPFDIIFSAFAILLHKFTREESFIIGGVSSRTKKLCPILAQISPAQTLSETVDAMIKSLQESEDSVVNMDDIALALHPGSTRAQALSKMFQVVVLNGTDVDAGSTIKNTAKEDWTLYIENVPDAKRLLPIRLRLIFNSIQFNRTRIKQALEQTEFIIMQLIANKERLIKETATLTPAMNEVLPSPLSQLSDKWNGPIYTFLEQFAKSKPEAPLIIHKEITYTYKQVDELSNRVANYLRANGVETGERVAMYSHRSSALVVGIMGILKAGATFTVIDPAYPVERQIVYLKVAQPRAVISMEAAGGIKPLVQEYIDTELNLRCQYNELSMTPTGALAEASVESAGVVVGPDDIGTLSFTSGSTGLPKGVRGRHVSLTHFYPWMSKEFGIGVDDRFSMLSGIAHDPIQRDIFTPIFYGATICIPDASDILEPGALAVWVRDYNVSVVHLTPAMGQLLTANATAQMPELKVALLVGDVLTKRDVKRLQRLACNITTVNMYGTTETQRAVSFLKIENDGSIDSFKEILPAGRGMEDVQLLVLSETMATAGLGELGEIFVRSPHMSAGYLRLPDATNEKFLQNPFSKDPTDRMYRTGDLGRFRLDGTVECVGRADDQIKIRGFRVELGEIDTHLGQHPNVRENKTLVMRDANEEKQIISFFVPLDNNYDIQSIRDHLKNKLPQYCVPTVICPIKNMPLTPNGKVDTRRLPYPDAAIILAQRPVTSEADSQELSVIGKLTLATFEKVLGRTILPSDNFFEIGGHSVMATQLTFCLRETLKQDFPLSLLYKCPSVTALSAALEETMEGPVAPSDVVVEDSDTIDVKAETTLHESIAPNGKTLPETISGVFLTGATGFLGAFLLAELLEKYPKTIIRCLTRAANDSAAFERVEKNLKNHLLWKPTYASRIVVVVGDLAKPLFGLTQTQFQELADRTDIIYHNGAVVHWVYPYSKMKATNVQSTVECLRLATMGETLASTHFVSSTSVFDSAYYMERAGPVLESESLEGIEGLTVGYAQSKWVAEKLMMKAMDRGVPGTIFRPGYVMGHSKTGVSNVDDYLARLLKGCVQLKKAPRIRNVINACPADFVAAAIVDIASKPSQYGKSFNFYQPKIFRFCDYFDKVADFGFEIEFVEYLDWKEALLKLTLSETQGNALYPLLHFVLDDLPAHSRGPQLDTKRLDEALSEGMSCPAIHDLMGIYLSCLINTGFLETTTLDAANAKEQLPVIDHSGIELQARSNRL
eukprot:m.128593 g.128593  ORF g.128593 m.128593 type:complete len:1288 (+) comp29345_c3_seq1:30-3893(+)